MKVQRRLVRGGLAVAAAVAVVGATSGLSCGSAAAVPRPHQRALPTACPPVPLWANTGGGNDHLFEYNPLTGAQMASVPLAQDYGDIAFSKDGTTLYGVTFFAVGGTLETINTATGAEEGPGIPITGGAAAAGSLNALTSLPDGTLLAASGNSSELWTIDPSTGASTLFGAQFPPGFFSAGDLTVLSDGDILALGAANPSPQTAVFRFHKSNLVDEIGTLPNLTTGLAQSGGQVYAFEAGGNIDQLPSPLPTTPSVNPLTFTQLAATGNAFFGASSVQDTGVCNLQPGTSYTVAKASSPAGPVSPGDTVTYTVTVKNTGSTPYFGNSASFTDDLTNVLDHATLVGSPAASAGTATISGTTLTWNGPLNVGASVTVTYKVQVSPNATGRLTNDVTATTPGGSCATAGGCTTTTGIQTPASSGGNSITIVNNNTSSATNHNTTTVTANGGNAEAEAEAAAEAELSTRHHSRHEHHEGHHMRPAVHHHDSRPQAMPSGK